MSIEKNVIKIPVDRKLCPFLEDPFDHCYCVKMSSQDIERAVYLCSKSFALCEIYKNNNGNDNGGNEQKNTIH